MSPPSSKGQSPKVAPPTQPGVYEALLFVSVAALIIGCIFLAMEMNEYGWTAAD